MDDKKLAERLVRLEKLSRDVDEAATMLGDLETQRDALRAGLLEEMPSLRMMFLPNSVKGPRATRQIRKAMQARKAQKRAVAKHTEAGKRSLEAVVEQVRTTLGVHGTYGVEVTIQAVAARAQVKDHIMNNRLWRAVQAKALIQSSYGGHRVAVVGKPKPLYTVPEKRAELEAAKKRRLEEQD